MAAVSCIVILTMPYLFALVILENKKIIIVQFFQIDVILLSIDSLPKKNYKFQSYFKKLRFVKFLLKGNLLKRPHNGFEG